MYRATLEGECGPGLRLASAESSAGTHHSVRHACNDAPTLERMLEYQVRAAEEADVELYWWSYKMPYGEAPAARRAGRFATPRLTVSLLAVHLPSQEEPSAPPGP